MGIGLLPILSGSVLGIILVAGLWPFQAPKNDVTWLSGGGLHFGPHGSLLSRGAFANPENKDSASIELWLRPDRPRSSRVILSFDSPSGPFAPFLLRQDRDSLVVLEPNRDRDGIYHTAWLPVKGVFRGNQTVFVTVTLGPQATSVYIDGALAQSFPILAPSNRFLLGQLVVADSPSVADSWSGEVLGLAFYRQELSSQQVTADYRNWKTNRRPAMAEESATIAWYSFGEGMGNVAHSQRDAAADLIVPARFFVLHPIFLRPPWREYRANLSYWKDAGVNVGGFIPLGFCFVACFSSLVRLKKPVAATIVFGFLTSLSIEVLQFWLPTRGSGMTDLMTNTFGTALGVCFYRWPFTQELLERAGALRGAIVTIGSDRGSL